MLGTYAMHQLGKRSTSRNPYADDWMCIADGAGKRNRTSDLRITNALLYQLSYSGQNLILNHAAPGRGAEGKTIYKKRSNNLRLCLSN